MKVPRSQVIAWSIVEVCVSILVISFAMHDVRLGAPGVSEVLCAVMLWALCSFFVILLGCVTDDDLDHFY